MRMMLTPFVLPWTETSAMKLHQSLSRLRLNHWQAAEVANSGTATATNDRHQHPPKSK
jgi:hypothetical protein